jgi:hypothetical protein
MTVVTSWVGAPLPKANRTPLKTSADSQTSGGLGGARLEQTSRHWLQKLTLGVVCLEHLSHTISFSHCMTWASHLAMDPFVAGVQGASLLTLPSELEVPPTMEGRDGEAVPSRLDKRQLCQHPTPLASDAWARSMEDTFS